MREGAPLHDEAEVSNLLECKLNVNTYKLFFVENTEDFLFRRRPAGTSTSDLARARAPQSQERFRRWLEGPTGWAMHLPAGMTAARSEEVTVEGFLHGLGMPHRYNAEGWTTARQSIGTAATGCCIYTTAYDVGGPGSAAGNDASGAVTMDTD